MDDRDEQVVQRTGSKERRIVTDVTSRSLEKGNSSGLNDELYFDLIEDFEGSEKFQSWKGQRRGTTHRRRSRWPSGRRMSQSFGGRSRQTAQGSRRMEELDEGEIFELDSEILDENDEVLAGWNVERTEFANDGTLIVEEYVLDDESLQAGLQRYNTKYQRGRGGFRRPSSSRGRKSYERQRQYEKYEIIDEKTFGNYASHSRMRSPHYRESESYRESFDSEVNPHGSRDWSKRNWNRDDNPTYRKKDHSPDNHRPADDKRYPEREESGKQFYEKRYHAVEGEGSSPPRRKNLPSNREGESPAEHRRRTPSVDKRDYSPLSPREQSLGWRRETTARSPDHGRERSWSRNKREISPPAAYKRRSFSPADNRRVYSPNHSDKRDVRGKDISPPKRRERSISPHTRGRRDSSMSSEKRDDSLSPVKRSQRKGMSRKREGSVSPHSRGRRDSSASSGKRDASVSPVKRVSQKSRKRDRSKSPLPRKRGRSSSSSSSGGGSSRSDSSHRELSPGKGGEREEHGTYSSRAGGHTRDHRRSANAVPVHTSQHGQDTSWKQPSETATQEYGAVQQQFGMESSGMTASSSTAVYPGSYSAYGAQPDMSTSGYHQAGHTGYDMYSYQTYYQPGAMQPAFGGDFTAQQLHPEWVEPGMFLPDMTQPPPLQVQVQGSVETEPESKADLKKSEEARKEAIKKEQKEQKLTLMKQREEYIKKSSVLTRELERLRGQKQVLMEEKSCEGERILKENAKLQLEIQNKLKAINNVIDMLTGIIGDKKDKKEEKRKSSKDSAKVEKRRSPDSSKMKDVEVEREEEEENEEVVYNYVYYDPELHWCRVCDVFPQTAKEYLHHLHSSEHKELTTKKKMVDMPWHKNKPEQEVPYYKGAPTKRTSIKGLQFLISVSSWYCKLCDSWIGDLHCVSLHLKSKLHLDNYKEFIDKNPKWELEWLTEREQAFQSKKEEALISKGVRKGESPEDFEPKLKDEPESDDAREEKVSGKAVVKEKTKSTGGTWAEVVAAPPRSTRIPTTSALGGVAHRTKPRTVLGGDDSSESEEGEVKTGRSIRVSMRNKPKVTVPGELNRNSWTTVEKDVKGTIKLKGEAAESEEEGELPKISSRREEKSFQEWMPKAPAAISDDDRQLLSNIKDRLKQKQEAEKERDEEKEKVEEKERKNDHEKFDYKEKSKGERDRYGRRSWDRDRSVEKGDWYRERDRRDRSRERKRRSRRFGSISPRRRSSERRSRYDKRYEAFKDRRRDRGDYRSDSRGDREREEKLYSVKAPDELEKKFDPFSKKEKKIEPKPPRPPKKLPDPTCPRTKLPFIGRMPLLKHIAKKKGPGGSKGEDGKDHDDGGMSPSHDKDEEMGKIEGVQDMDIDDDNSEGELPDSQEKDIDFKDQEEISTSPSKESAKKDDDASLFTETSSHAVLTPSSAAPVVTKVSRFGPLMEMSSGPKLLTSFDQPSGVQIQLCAPAKLAAPVLMPPGTVAESISSVEAGEGKPKTKTGDDIPLPKDFQDALNILFPEKSAMGADGSGVPLGPPGVALTPPGMPDGSQDMNSQSGMVHHVGIPMAHGIPHGMHPLDPSAHHVYTAPPPMHMPPPMHHQMAMAGPAGGVLMPSQMMGQPMEQEMPSDIQEADESENLEPVPEDEPIREETEVSDKVARRKYVEMGEDELAMLGIDPEDMAAQTFAPKRPYT